MFVVNHKAEFNRFFGLWIMLLLFICNLSASAVNPQKNKMKELNVKKVSAAAITAEAVPALLDKENVAFQSINSINWKEYSYCPDAQFRIAYTNDAILVHYKVTEASVRAAAEKDNGEVWKDACAEFFCIPANDEVYYNVECNCAGTLLIGAGKVRSERGHATQEVMDKVLRWSSLGRKPFAERVGESSWEMALVIPFSAFYMHQITSLEGKTIRANFYKCGDDLQTPHYISWNPIGLPKPNFHCPDYFGTLHFVK